MCVLQKLPLYLHPKKTRAHCVRRVSQLVSGCVSGCAAWQCVWLLHSKVAVVIACPLLHFGDGLLAAHVEGVEKPKMAWQRF